MSTRYCLKWKVLDQITHSVWTNWHLTTAALLTILAGRRSHALHMLSVICMGQSLDQVIFQIIGLIICSKPYRPYQPVVYRAYVEEEILCPVKCIYAYLTRRSEIVIQDFTEFCITSGQPYHPASKDMLARWVKEIMRNSGIDTKILKPHSTRVASNSAAYKLGMVLQEVLKKGHWSNEGTFFTYYFREIKDSLDLLWLRNLCLHAFQNPFRLLLEIDITKNNYQR